VCIEHATFVLGYGVIIGRSWVDSLIIYGTQHAYSIKIGPTCTHPLSSYVGGGLGALQVDDGYDVCRMPQKSRRLVEHFAACVVLVNTAGEDYLCFGLAPAA
jgi:hypothetical protein